MRLRPSCAAVASRYPMSKSFPGGAFATSVTPTATRGPCSNCCIRGVATAVSPSAEHPFDSGQEGPGPRGERNPGNEDAGCSSDTAGHRTLRHERGPGQVGAPADRFGECRVADADFLADRDELSIGQTGTTLRRLILEQRPGVLMKHSGIRGRRRRGGGAGGVPGGRYRVQEVHRVAREGDQLLLQQPVHGGTGHQLELLAERALEVDICLDICRPGAHHDAVTVGIRAPRDLDRWGGGLIRVHADNALGSLAAMPRPVGARYVRRIRHRGSVPPPVGTRAAADQPFASTRNIVAVVSPYTRCALKSFHSVFASYSHIGW